MGCKSRLTETGGPFSSFLGWLGMYSIMESETLLYRNGIYWVSLRVRYEERVKFILTFDMSKLIKRSKSEVLSLFGQLLGVRFCYISYIQNNCI